MIQESINQEIIKHLNAAQQIQWAIAKNLTSSGGSSRAALLRWTTYEQFMTGTTRSMRN
ncbi:hypothetical protein X992_4331 [Burkholderia pseudomallei MSHR5492]|nr:hypothetical protein X992_4331 [Burkholderia pseudomallei MSHR5492]